MARSRNRAVDLLAAQSGAAAYALDYVQETPLGLPQDLTDDAFKQVMDSVVRAIAAAWAAGYLAAKDAK
jgi:hypothetical protein